ncbi:MAG TPA: dihydrodipicolinate synthase family protein [Xanthobacteraceae bacterium]|nr:dihydrodipicolinate synthase family protein [Xanthobacteraceae bacterium]
MKYRKSEAKEYARSVLKGVWTALPSNFTPDDRLDEAATADNLRYCIDELEIEGHYCLGNVAEFWSMTNEERMRVHEINVDVAKGRVPLIAGCHHQNPYEAVKLCNHARAVGIDFAIVLTPYMGAKDDDGVFEFYRFIAERTDIGIVLFNIPSVYYPINERLAKRLVTIPNICAFKQANPSPLATVSLREAIGDQVIISVADEAPWLYNLTVGGDDWLLNYSPHLYQVPGYLPVRDYTRAALAGDMKTAKDIAASLNALRAVQAKWVNGYGRPSGRLPAHEQKVWMEFLGMVGGPVRAPATPMSEEAKRELREDLAATGILDRVRQRREERPLKLAV